MDKYWTELTDEPIVETPEDVAILYSWANLHGARYRDFSASRREYRAQVRHRAAEELRQAELAAQAAAEAAAAEAERKAREAERLARSSFDSESPFLRERALREAEEAARRAAADRVEAARRAEAAAIAEAAARREEREIAEAHASSQRQEQRWHESDIRLRGYSGSSSFRPQTASVTSSQFDPYESAQGSTVDAALPTPNLALEQSQPSLYRAEAARTFRTSEPAGSGPRGFIPDRPSGVRTSFRPASRESSRTDFVAPVVQRPMPVPTLYPEPMLTPTPAVQSTPDRPWSIPVEPPAPAWLSGSAALAPVSTESASAQFRAVAESTAAAAVGADTLQRSRELVASRWQALQSVFDIPEPVAAPPKPEASTLVPVLAVFSLAGGVGKTTMVATLGRTLASLGEKVLLAETTSHGLLPYYFGATELEPHVLRSFSPPAGTSHPPISLISYPVGYEAQPDPHPADSKARLADEVLLATSGSQRLIIDCNSASGWLIRSLHTLPVTVLIPVAPDMNAVLGLQAIERYFQGVLDHNGNQILPYYLINQFDASLPLHLDVRTVLRKQLGDRLLTFVIRRSSSVSEALAEGTTVVDYQPQGTAAEDYRDLAHWLRQSAPPATLAPAPRNIQWRER